MTIPTPLHDATARRCESLLYKDWAGYYAIASYDTCHEREYYAMLHYGLAHAARWSRPMR